MKQHPFLDWRQAVGFDSRARLGICRTRRTEGLRVGDPPFSTGREDRRFKRVLGDRCFSFKQFVALYSVTRRLFNNVRSVSALVVVVET